MSSNADLFRRRALAIPRGVVTAFPIVAARAENAEIWDVEGKRYIDFAAGVAVLNVGHRHAKVMQAVQEQLERFTHTAFQVIAYESYIELAERLSALAPIDAPAKTILFTTGAEATENAVKIARVATGRPAVIAFAGGFHGRTLLASALTGKTKPYKQGIEPLPAGIFHVPFPSEAQGVSVEQSLQALSFVFNADVAADKVAAIIIEPVQGEGGFHVAPPEFLRALRTMCDTHGILLIADEVQSGIARTGRMFAMEHSGVRPDLLAAAKSLGGGLPISAVIGRAEIIDRVEPGGLGGTYAGPPVACAAALAVLDVIREEGLLGRAQSIGAHVKRRISELSQLSDDIAISSPRGLGAMVAFDVLGSSSRAPDGARAKQVCVAALERGLIVLTCGAAGEGIRILAPLTISDELLDEGLDRLKGALAAART